jgi:bifunctional enzyme CysN/CysC
MASSNVTWHASTVHRDERDGCTTKGGATLWLTGLSGSGKSTVAAAVEHRLVQSGRSAYRLDGDNLRTGLNADLGFGREARLENARRAGEVAALFADAGVVVVVALISPYAESRQWARALHERAGLPFAEVYLAAPVDLCSSRDPKGLYAKASAGEIGSFTGVDDPYEVPAHPDLSLEPGLPLADAVDRVLATLARAEATG